MNVMTVSAVLCLAIFGVIDVANGLQVITSTLSQRFSKLRIGDSTGTSARLQQMRMSGTSNDDLQFTNAATDFTSCSTVTRSFPATIIWCEHLQIFVILTLSAHKRNDPLPPLHRIHLTDLTPHLIAAIESSGVVDGQVNILSRHTTTAITINEMVSDILNSLFIPISTIIT
jgi:hypothetical protein